jgi:hypothetical protein
MADVAELQKDLAMGKSDGSHEDPFEIPVRKAVFEWCRIGTD